MRSTYSERAPLDVLQLLQPEPEKEPRPASPTRARLLPRRSPRRPVLRPGRSRSQPVRRRVLARGNTDSKSVPASHSFVIVAGRSVIMRLRPPACPCLRGSDLRHAPASRSAPDCLRSAPRWVLTSASPSRVGRGRVRGAGVARARNAWDARHRRRTRRVRRGARRASRSAITRPSEPASSHSQEVRRASRHRHGGGRRRPAVRSQARGAPRIASVARRRARRRRARRPRQPATAWER